MEYLLAKDKDIDESFLKDIVVGCYVKVMLARMNRIKG